MVENLTRDDALLLIQSSSRYTHSIRVAEMMKQLAGYFNENVHEWEMVGLLHDLDYDETVENRQLHGILAGEILQGKLSNQAIEAIKSHDYRTQIKPKNRLARVLIACDALDVLLELMQVKEMNIDKVRVTQLLETWTIEKPWLRELITNVKMEQITLDLFLDYCLLAFKKINE
jgi:predicted hydrolase (HD superfamily)